MLTQPQLEALFAKLRIIHKSHWKTPKLENVAKEIERTGAFVFRIGSNPWVAEIIITETVKYEVNPALPERMLAVALEMKKKFDSADSSNK